MNAVVRGDVGPVRIGAETNVQDGSLLHLTRGGQALSIGSQVTLADGTVYRVSGDPSANDPDRLTWRLPVAKV